MKEEKPMDYIAIDCHLKWFLAYKRVLAYKHLPKAHKRQALNGMRACASWLANHGVSDLTVFDSVPSMVKCRVGAVPYCLEVR